MRIITTLEKSIDIYDCFAFASGVVEDKLLSICRDNFAGRCHNKIYISDIARIISYSELIVNQNGQPNYATMSVKMEIDGVSYAVGEIIPNCKILSTEKSNIIGKVDNINVILEGDELSRSLKRGQVVAISVVMGMFKTGSGAIGIYGRIMSELPTPPIISSAFIPYIMNDVRAKGYGDTIAQLGQNSSNRIVRALLPAKATASTSDQIFAPVASVVGIGVIGLDKAFVRVDGSIGRTDVRARQLLDCNTDPRIVADIFYSYVDIAYGIVVSLLETAPDENYIKILEFQAKMPRIK